MLIGGTVIFALVAVLVIPQLCTIYTATHSSLILIAGIMTVGYLAEVALIPYERLLEVQHSYKSLVHAYIPYCSGLVLIVFIIVTAKFFNLTIHLWFIILLIMGVRLVSMLVMRNFARQLITHPKSSSMVSGSSASSPRSNTALITESHRSAFVSPS
jgi:hypothetical protein